MFFLISFLFTLFYTGIMFLYRNKWNELIETTGFSDRVATHISVIIPARNEAASISNILNDVLAQNYPSSLFEVIVIDDNSDDKTFAISSQFATRHSQVRVFKLSELSDKNNKTSAYKKQAIESAVNLAKGTLIITTDADCRVQENWLRSIASFYETEQCKLIAAPVCFHHDKTKFQKFQALDFCGMQAITAASLELKIFNMANGANLAYEKEAFLSVKGYHKIDDKASGDDMLLVYKIAQKFPDSIRFLKNKEAIVYTEPCKNIQEFLQQRFRWTSKSGSYQDKRITIILGLVYLFVLSIWINAFCFLFSSTFHVLTFGSDLFPLLLFQLAAKSITDYFFLSSASGFFGRKDLMKSFVSSELLHLWYIPFVGTFGNILPYNWKGRKLK
ncbi:MAG: glycosyl transferase family 2 [Bacteroidota bacterium]|nr:glycosyl transferase family 2 [Bacteroidota bacterium]